MTVRKVLSSIAVVLLLSACGNGNDRDEQAGGGSTSTPGTGTTAPPDGSAPPPSEPGGSGRTDDGTGHDGTDDDGTDHAPPFPANTAPDHGQASPDARGTITAIRLGHHDGFDRVVFEFHGPGTPGWTVRYVPQATAQGSGEPIDRAGDAVLSVAITGVGYPTETGLAEVRRGEFSVAATHVVTEAFYDGTFEGISQAFVGTTGELPFRVYLLPDPARVVLEVREH
jgi:hypothetical protein